MTVAIVITQQEPITFWEIMSIFLSEPAGATEALSYTFSLNRSALLWDCALSGV